MFTVGVTTQVFHYNLGKDSAPPSKSLCVSVSDVFIVGPILLDAILIVFIVMSFLFLNLLSILDVVKPIVFFSCDGVFKRHSLSPIKRPHEQGHCTPYGKEIRPTLSENTGREPGQRPEGNVDKPEDAEIGFLLAFLFWLGVFLLESSKIIVLAGHRTPP